MDSRLFKCRDRIYPAFLRQGNAQQYVAAIAKQFCLGIGLDVGSGAYPLEGAIPIDRNFGGDAMELPVGLYDFVFSSHALEHLPNPVAAIEHWKTRLRRGGVLFLYLPSADFTGWLPQWNREHLHVFRPNEVAVMLRDLGFVDVIHSERDLAWGFSVVGFTEA